MIRKIDKHGRLFLPRKSWEKLNTSENDNSIIVDEIDDIIILTRNDVKSQKKYLKTKIEILKSIEKK